MRLQEAIHYMGAEAPGIDPALMERDVVSFVIDSREVQAGDVFFALSQPEYADNGFNGEFDDATVYVETAFENGAVAAIVRRDRFEEHIGTLSEFEDRLIFAEDVIAALQRLAHEVYLKWSGPVVAITGSAGKTTAKELTAHVLGDSGKKVLKNIKNYNNGLGHPLTVLNLAKDPTYDIAVLEMGMSTPMNEIARLCRITPPDVSVVLNVLPVHIEHLGSIENIAAAKSEIVEGLKPGGVAVLNADDTRVAAMRSLTAGRVITYGFDNNANVKATEIEYNGFGSTRFLLTTPNGSTTVSFPLNGRHNILNALAAASVGYVYGMPAQMIGDSLGSVAPPPQRGEVINLSNGALLINDSYNSNPDALLSMVDTLRDGAASAPRRIVVAGEMLELGDDAERLHREAGFAIAGKNVDLLIGVRGFARYLVEGAKEGGLDNAVFASDAASAGEMLANQLVAGDVVLIKGSRGVRTEKVVEKLADKFGLERSSAVQR